MKITTVNLKSKYKLIRFIICTVSVLLLLFIIGETAMHLYLASDKYEEAISKITEENVIILDAGHGGEDCGAIGVNGVYEKDLNFELAKELGNLLCEKGFAVIYTRSSDALLYTEKENVKGIRKISDLKNRCKIGAENPNAIFISIHMNSFGDAKYSGLQVYYSERGEESRMLANSVQESVKATVQKENNRKTKPGKNMYLLENLENTSILIECGFLTNKEECEKLCEKEYQKELSFAILCGIIEYKSKKLS